MLARSCVNMTQLVDLPEACPKHLCLSCRLEPESKSMAADLKALIAEHEAASPLHLPSVTIPVKSDSAQSSVPAEQPQQGTRPETEPRQAQEARQVEAKAVGAASNAQVPGQHLQHPPSKAQHDKLAPIAPIPAAVDSRPKAETSSRSPQHSFDEASPAPVQKRQQAGASPRTEQVTCAEAAQSKAAATAEAVSSQGSFLGKALSGASAKPRLPGDAQLSTSQAQQIADAAAAGTLPPQHKGSQSLNGTGQHHSTDAASASSASKGLTARSLQPPKTSKHDRHGLSVHLTTAGNHSMQAARQTLELHAILHCA